MRNSPAGIGRCLLRALCVCVALACCAAIAAADEPAWRSLFDGRKLGGFEKSNFGGTADVSVRDGAIRIELAEGCNGVTWTKDLPTIDYEIQLEAARLDGHDFFCGLTFPVRRDADRVEHCTLVVGGWGGGLVGLSCLDGEDAANNHTSSHHDFKKKQWYTIRLRVTKPKIEAWIDDEKVIDADIESHTLSVRFEVEKSKPLGIATWCTTAAVRNVKIREQTK